MTEEQRKLLIWIAIIAAIVVLIFISGFGGAGAEVAEMSLELERLGLPAPEIFPPQFDGEVVKEE